jgi:protease IV
MLARVLNLNPDRIAVTELFGAIGSPARTTEFIRMLRAIEENNKIRALVIDIDSPGGAAGPSEYLFSAVSKIAKKKPVIAFVRGTGASGAYMVAAGATKIIAVSMRPMLYEMLSKIGVRMEITKSGRLKDMFSNFREPTPEEKEREQALIDSFYERFVQLVSEARSMPADRVKELATGEVFTAPEAQANGLIDGLGDLDTAIDMAQSLAELPERKVTYVRPHRGLRDRLLSGTATQLVEAVAWAVEGRMTGGVRY